MKDLQDVENDAMEVADKCLELGIPPPTIGLRVISIHAQMVAALYYAETTLDGDWPVWVGGYLN